jgi:hypothetical protein
MGTWKLGKVPAWFEEWTFWEKLSRRTHSEKMLR